MRRAKYHVPASSSPWLTNPSVGDYSKQLVHYAEDKTYGAYYTWCVATAGCNNESYSVCPKGWKMPDILAYKNMLKNAKIDYEDCEDDVSCTGSSSASDSAIIHSTPYKFIYAG